MIDFNAVAPEVFSLIRSRDFTADIYDGEGDRVIEPEDGRRFYIVGENHLIALVDDNENSTIKVRISKSADISDLIDFIESLRACANKYNMLFDIKRGDRDYQPKDFATSFSITNESREGIIMENAHESIEMPLVPEAIAAMDAHTSNGGSFYDAVGYQIARMANDFSNLIQCAQFINQAEPQVQKKLDETIQTGQRRIIRSLGRFAYNPVRESLLSAPLRKQAMSFAQSNLKGAPESIMESVARYIGEQHMNHDNVIVRFTPSNRGFEVSKKVWNDFQNGTLDLISPPEGLDDLDQEERFEIIVPLVRDDYLMNLLSHVATRLKDNVTGDEKNKLERVRLAALKALRLDETVKLTGALLEFQQWFNGMQLNEGKLDDKHEDKKDFEYSEFIVSDVVADKLGDNQVLTEDDVLEIAKAYFGDKEELVKESLDEILKGLRNDGYEVKTKEKEQVNEGLEIQLTTTQPIEWIYLGRGSNDDGEQGFYHKGVEGDTEYVVFVHADVRKACIDITSPVSSSFEEINFLNELDLANQISDIISRNNNVEIITTGEIDDTTDLGINDIYADVEIEDDFVPEMGVDFVPPVEELDIKENDDVLVPDEEVLIELEDEEILTREDILLPDDENVSLKAEIASDIDNSEMDALAQAAGIKRSNNATIMQGIPVGLVGMGPV